MVIHRQQWTIHSSLSEEALQSIYTDGGSYAILEYSDGVLGILLRKMRERIEEDHRRFFKEWLSEQDKNHNEDSRTPSETESSS